MSSQKIWQNIFATPSTKRKIHSDSEDFLRNVGVVVSEENGNRVKYTKDGVILAIHRTDTHKKLRPLQFIENMYTNNNAMNCLNYNGYSGTVEYSQEGDCLFGRILGIDDIITYEAESIKNLHIAFEQAVDDYIINCEQLGKKPRKSYSGKFILRVGPALHAKLASYAQVQNISLNQYVANILEDFHE